MSENIKIIKQFVGYRVAVVMKNKIDGGEEIVSGILNEITDKYFKIDERFYPLGVWIIKDYEIKSP